MSAIGFLPQGSLLYLPLDRLNLPLITTAVMILDGLEMAVFQGALETITYEHDCIVYKGFVPKAIYSPYCFFWPFSDPFFDYL